MSKISLVLSFIDLLMDKNAWENMKTIDDRLNNIAEKTNELMEKYLVKSFTGKPPSQKENVRSSIHTLAKEFLLNQIKKILELCSKAESSFPDPITKKLMLHPVLLKDTGSLFEKSVLVEHLKHHDTDPISGMLLKDKKWCDSITTQKNIQKHIKKMLEDGIEIVKATLKYFTEETYAVFNIGGFPLKINKLYEEQEKAFEKYFKPLEKLFATLKYYNPNHIALLQEEEKYLMIKGNSTALFEVRRKLSSLTQESNEAIKIIHDKILIPGLAKTIDQKIELYNELLLKYKIIKDEKNIICTVLTLVDLYIKSKGKAEKIAGFLEEYIPKYPNRIDLRMKVAPFQAPKSASETYYFLANHFHKNLKNTNEAMKYAKLAIEKNKNHKAAHEMLLDFYISQKNNIEASKELKFLGQALAETNSNDDSSFSTEEKLNRLKLLEKSLLFNPNDIETRKVLLNGYFEANQFEKIISLTAEKEESELTKLRMTYFAKLWERQERKISKFENVIQKSEGIDGTISKLQNEMEKLKIAKPTVTTSQNHRHPNGNGEMTEILKKIGTQENYIQQLSLNLSRTTQKYEKLRMDYSKLENLIAGMNKKIETLARREPVTPTREQRRDPRREQRREPVRDRFERQAPKSPIQELKEAGIEDLNAERLRLERQQFEIFAKEKQKRDIQLQRQMDRVKLQGEENEMMRNVRDTQKEIEMQRRELANKRQREKEERMRRDEENKRKRREFEERRRREIEQRRKRDEEERKRREEEEKQRREAEELRRRNEEEKLKAKQYESKKLEEDDEDFFFDDDDDEEEESKPEPVTAEKKPLISEILDGDDDSDDEFLLEDDEEQSKLESKKMQLETYNKKQKEMEDMLDDEEFILPIEKIEGNGIDDNPSAKAEVPIKNPKIDGLNGYVQFSDPFKLCGCSWKLKVTIEMNSLVSIYLFLLDKGKKVTANFTIHFSNFSKSSMRIQFLGGSKIGRGIQKGFKPPHEPVWKPIVEIKVLSISDIEEEKTDELDHELSGENFDVEDLNSEDKYYDDDSNYYYGDDY